MKQRVLILQLSLLIISVNSYCNAIGNGINTQDGSIVNNSRSGAGGGGTSAWSVIFFNLFSNTFSKSDINTNKVDVLCDFLECKKRGLQISEPNSSLFLGAQMLSYTITYLGNGHTQGLAPNSGTFTAPTTISGPGSLTRTDYRFIEWNTSADGSGTRFSQGSQSTVGTNLILYAQWELADEHIWHGTQDSTWNNGNNWSSGVIPNNGAHIRFATNAQNNLHLSGNITINTLNFNGSDKKLVLNDFHLHMSDEISGASISSYAQTNGLGTLSSNINAASSFTFPVGNAYYNALNITNNNPKNDVFSIRVIDTVYIHGTSGQHLIAPQVKATWEINKTNPNSASGVDFEFTWHEEQEFYGINNFELKHHNGETWELAAGNLMNISNAAYKTMRHDNYTGTFSPFAIIDGNIPLPVSLTSFNAHCDEDKVNIYWTTASEFNASHYSVQTSRDGQTWTEVAEIEAAGTTSQTTNYFYQDQKFAGVSYYRLVQVDLDGASEIYGPISVDCEINESSMTVYPNPTDADFTVLIQTSETFENATIELVDLSGRAIEVKEMTILPGSTIIRLETLKLMPGTYIVRIKGENDKFTPIRVVIL